MEKKQMERVEKENIKLPTKIENEKNNQLIVQNEENGNERISCIYCTRSFMRKNMGRHVEAVHLVLEPSKQTKIKIVTKSKKRKISENNDEKNIENFDRDDFYIPPEVITKEVCKSCDRTPKEIQLKDFGVGNGKLLPDEKELTKYNRIGAEYLVFVSSRSLKPREKYTN